MTQEKDFSLELEENAIDSLVHGIEHFLESEEYSDLKYALLHTFNAVELLLKSRLAKEHPTLIFTKPEEARAKDPKTVEFWTLINRLKASGVELTKGEIDDLDFLRQIRNKVEHHRIETSQQSVQDYIGRAIKFLEKFMREELDLTLQDEVEEKVYRKLSEMVHTYEERLQRAKAEIERLLPYDKDRLLYDILYCEECSEKTVPVPDPGNKGSAEVQCYFCGAVYNEPDICSGCGAHFLGGLGEDVMCSGCWSHLLSKN